MPDDGDNFGPVKMGRFRINAPYKAVNLLKDRQLRLPLFMDKFEKYPIDPGSYKIQPSTITYWLDTRESE